MRVNAKPTKGLFIDMLTRDIWLIPSILDLVDNAADAARKLRGQKNYKGLFIRINTSSDTFEISDNCGGMTVALARKYAFRFGRAKGMPRVKHSVGEFGVGMKRAIFKMGDKFRVESRTATSRFVVEHDVREWADDPENWDFKFSELQEKIRVKKELQGTTICISSLHDDVRESFELKDFLNELRGEITVRLQEFLTRGLIITLNGIPVETDPEELISDQRLAPVFRKLRLPSSGAKHVKVKLYCGLGAEGQAAIAGWYVYCNGRLILEADKSTVTGWGLETEDDVSLPRFHNQFNLFRGFAYFDSDDLGLLPWNTTKTGLNTDSKVYRSVKLQMMTLMRSVIDFLNKLKDEKTEYDLIGETGPLRKMLDNSAAKPVGKGRTRTSFVAPKTKRPPKRGPKVQRIQYDVPADKFEAVKRALKVRSIKQVGVKTFEYYYDSEIED